MNDNLNFERLMEQVQAGSFEAVEELVEKYGLHIQAVVRRSLHRDLRPMYDSMDFVQAVWVSLVRMQDQLGELDTPDKFMAYLSVMARNKVIDEYRRFTRTQKNDLSRHETLDIERDSECAEDRNLRKTPSQFAIARERWEQIVANESQRARHVIELRRDGMSFAEISANLQIDESSARQIIQRVAEKIALETHAT